MLELPNIICVDNGLGNTPSSHGAGDREDLAALLLGAREMPLLETVSLRHGADWRFDVAGKASDQFQD